MTAVADSARQKRDLAAFIRGHDLSPEALSMRLFRRYSEQIAIKKETRAIGNLQRIMGAAIALCESGSFHEMTMRDLARKAGISIGALYVYIADKETLLEMMLDVVTDAIERVLTSKADSCSRDPAAQLKFLIVQHLRLTEAMPAWFRFLFIEAKGFSAAGRRRVKQAEVSTEALLYHTLEAGRLQGVFAIDDAQMTAALIKPLLQDWYLKRWKHRARGVDLGQYAEFVFRFIEDAIGAKRMALAASS